MASLRGVAVERGELNRLMWYSLSSREKLGVLSVSAVALSAAAWVGYDRMTAPQAPAPGATVSAAAPEQFPVHVAGAVKEPALITAGAGMLVQDAIRDAGGAGPGADLKRLNLAARLLPNTRLYVPSLGEDVSDAELGPYGPLGAPQARGGGDAAAGGLININTAAEAELDRLPGVGPVTAKKIIEYRNSIGGFKTIDQLIEVKGIGPKKLEQIRPHVRL